MTPITLATLLQVLDQMVELARHFFCEIKNSLEVFLSHVLLITSYNQLGPKLAGRSMINCQEIGKLCPFGLL